MKSRSSSLSRIVVALLVACESVLLSVAPAHASPFGQGAFGANVPFGSATSISINVGGDVALALAPSGGNFSGSNAHTVTVTSTDVVGYYLYAHATGSTAMANGSQTITASNNSSPGPLSVGTWGYNTTSSPTDFLGMNASSVLLKDASGPFKNGDATIVTYGALTNGTQAAGNYSIGMTYTTVAKNQ
jgi:hypothetical protein